MVRMSRDWKMQRRTIHSPDWDDDETVTIRCYYGDHDRQRVTSSSTEYVRDEQTGQMRIVATLDRMHATKRTLAVVGWTLKDSDGNPLPFTEDNLINLPTYVAEFIDSEINADWDDLGEPVATKEEADALEREEKEDRATFQGDGVHPAQRPGKAVTSSRNERARSGAIEPGSAEIAH